ncbi:MAG: hypothetical protein ACKOW3_10105, partial [Hyphomicrobium sp.]
MNTSWSIDFTPTIPSEIIGAIAIVAALLCIIIFFYQKRGGFARIFAICGMLLILLNPTLHQEDRSPLKNIAIVLIDESTSQ